MTWKGLGLGAWGSKRRWLAGIGAILIIAIGIGAGVGRGSAPDLPTAEVTTGEFIDAVELRGEIRPVRSVVMAAPMQSGDLQIVKLARNGSTVKAGDLVVLFDTSTVDRTILEKRTEVKQAEAEINQARAQMKIADEQTATALMKARYDVDRSKIDVSAQSEELNSKIDREKAKLALADAEQRLKESGEKAQSDRAAAQADLNAKLRKREKALADLQRAERSRQNLEMRAPADGMVSIMPNFRAGGMFGSNPPEFREGDRAWSGAQVVELPDLSEIRFEARLDETDRGRRTVGDDSRRRRTRSPVHGNRVGCVGPRPHRLLIRHLAPRAELRSEVASPREGPAAPSGHEFDSPHCRRSPAGVDDRADPSGLPEGRPPHRLRARRTRLRGAPRGDCPAG
jgi:multidrug efflux pump subunit AcrA (membrane-fusion protein)